MYLYHPFVEILLLEPLHSFTLIPQKVFVHVLTIIKDEKVSERRKNFNFQNNFCRNHNVIVWRRFKSTLEPSRRG